jgi:hypothetical protein
MKKIIMLILGIIAISQAAIAQDYDSLARRYHIQISHADYGYSFYDTENEISYYIFFYEEEEVYHIHTIWSFFDEHASQVLSSGFFKRNGKEIYLYDTLTNLKMEAKIENDFLEFAVGYKLLTNKTFIPSSLLDVFAFESYILANCTDLIETIRALRYRRDYTEVVEYGDYYDYPGWFGHAQLRLEENGTFIFGKLIFYDNRPPLSILEGTWTQKGNLIILHDEHTDHDFYLIYEYPNLRTMLLPGDWSIDGTVLTPQ